MGPEAVTYYILYYILSRYNNYIIKKTLFRFGYGTACSTKTKRIRTLKKARIFVPGETMLTLMNSVAIRFFLFQTKDADG